MAEHAPDLSGHPAPPGLDRNVLAGLPAPRLLLADMDSTLIEQECLDEIADLAGLGTRVAAITDAAMRGELDFEAALRERVGLLAGEPAALIQRTLDERITLTPGAAVMARVLRAAGTRLVLVSGGFTAFTGAVAERLGFDAHYGNRLEIAGEALTGEVVPPILGRAAKRERMEAERSALGLAPAQTAAIGDGANDLDMLRATPLGIAFRAKPVVAAAAPLRLDHADLSAVPALFGLDPSG